jgi:hypothetical protein
MDVCPRRRDSCGGNGRAWSAVARKASGTALLVLFAKPASGAFAAGSASSRQHAGHLRSLEASRQQQALLASSTSTSVSLSTGGQAAASHIQLSELTGSSAVEAPAAPPQIHGMFGLPPDYNCFARVCVRAHRCAACVRMAASSVVNTFSPTPPPPPPSSRFSGLSS